MSYLRAALAAWRLTHLLAFEDGPFRSLERARRWSERFSAGFSCFYCLSAWVPLPFAWIMGGDGAERFLLWAGGSGAIVLLHKMSGGDRTAAYWEEGERNDELLRKDETP